MLVTGMDMPNESHAVRVSAGPRAASELANFKGMSQNEKDKWFTNAGMRAVLGACARTLPSVRSGVRCFLAFAGRHR
jgi:hypothetical protein